MRSLHDLQRRCYDAFVHGDAERLVPFVAGTAPTARISVYRNNAQEIARKTLQITFPVLHRLVGDDCFRTLSRDYLRRCASPSGNLEDFGAAFPQFLDAVYGGGDFDYLGDVARLEWACEQAWVAPESNPGEFSSLAAVSAEGAAAVGLTLHPSCQVIASAYPVLSIWRTNIEELDETVHLDAGAEYALVGRAASGIDVQPLTAPEAAFLLALQQGASLGDACDAGLAVDGEFDPGNRLQSLALRGWITAATPFTSPEPRGPS